MSEQPPVASPSSGQGGVISSVTVARERPSTSGEGRPRATRSPTVGSTAPVSIKPGGGGKQRMKRERRSTGNPNDPVSKERGGGSAGSADRKDSPGPRTIVVSENLNLKDVIILALGLTIGGFYTFWNEGLHIGLYYFIGCVVIVGLAFIASSLCLAELTSALPFSGGMYGIVRLTAGPYAGYIVGWCEMIQNVLRTSCVIACASLHFSDALQISRLYEPIMWLILVNISVLSNAKGGKFFWNLGLVFTSTSIALLLVFLFSTMFAGSLERNMSDPSPVNFSDGGSVVFNIIRYFPRATWFFVGIEMVPLAISDCIAPKQTVPKAVFSCTLILFFLAISTVIAVCSLQKFSVNDVINDRMPLAHGFVNGLHVPERMGAILAGPGLFCTAYYFMYPFSRQVKAMAESNLLPAFMKHTGGTNNTPVVALAVGSLAVFFFIVMTRIFERRGSVEYFAGLSLMATCCVYIMMAYSYLVFHTRYYSLLPRDTIFLSKRWIDNEGGKYCAYYVLGVFTFIIISLVGFYREYAMVFWPFVIFIIALTINYIVNVSTKQCFSEEEQKKLMMAYVINRNMIKQKRDQERALEVEALQRDMQFVKKSSSSAGGEENSYSRNGSIYSQASLFQHSFSGQRNAIPGGGAGAIVIGKSGVPMRVGTGAAVVPVVVKSLDTSTVVPPNPNPPNNVHHRNFFNFLGRGIRSSSSGTGNGGMGSERHSSSISHKSGGSSSGYQSHSLSGNTLPLSSGNKYVARPDPRFPYNHTNSGSHLPTIPSGNTGGFSNSALTLGGVSTGYDELDHSPTSSLEGDDFDMHHHTVMSESERRRNMLTMKSFESVSSTGISGSQRALGSGEGVADRDTIMKNHPIRPLHTIDRHGTNSSSSGNGHGQSGTSLTGSSNLLTRSFMFDHDLYIPQGYDVASPRSEPPSPMAYQTMLQTHQKGKSFNAHVPLAVQQGHPLESVRETPGDIENGLVDSTKPDFYSKSGEDLTGIPNGNLPSNNPGLLQTRSSSSKHIGPNRETLMSLEDVDEERSVESGKVMLYPGGGISSPPLVLGMSGGALAAAEAKVMANARAKAAANAQQPSGAVGFMSRLLNNRITPT